MEQANALCPVWMPSDWEASPGTELNGEGWITSRPRRSQMRNLVATHAPLWRRQIDEEALLSTSPHLAIALLRRNLFAGAH